MNCLASMVNHCRPHGSPYQPGDLSPVIGRACAQSVIVHKWSAKLAICCSHLSVAVCVFVQT